MAVFQEKCLTVINKLMLYLLVEKLLSYLQKQN